MADPATIYGAVEAGGAIFSGLSEIFGSDPRQAGSIYLPPELEERQLELLNQAIEDFQRERARSMAIADSLESRARLQESVSRGLIPSEEAFKQITKQNEQLALAYGGELLKQVNELSGGITAEAKKLLTTPYQDFKDPTVERDIENGRVQLEEQLARQLGPGYAQSEAGIRALRAFEEGATNLRVQGSREAVDRLGKISAVASNQFESLTRGRLAAEGSLVSGLYAGDKSFENLSNAQNQRYTAAQASLIPFAALQQFGQQNLSDDIVEAIKSGRYGKNFESDLEKKRAEFGGGQGTFGALSGINPVTGRSSQF